MQRAGKGAKKSVESDEWRKSPVEYRLEYALVKVCVVLVRSLTVFFGCSKRKLSSW